MRRQEGRSNPHQPLTSNDMQQCMGINIGVVHLFHYHPDENCSDTWCVQSKIVKSFQFQVHKKPFLWCTCKLTAERLFKWFTHDVTLTMA